LNIIGNEEANRAVKEGAALPIPLNTTYILGSLKRIAKIEAKKARTQPRAITALISYRELLISYC
jgi:hypothetical protein